MLKSALVLFAILRTISANDYRELFYYPPDLDETEFQEKWTDACQGYEPAGYTYQGQYFRDGDYSGENLGEQALIFCTYKDSTTGAITPFTDDVAAEIGATHV